MVQPTNLIMYLNYDELCGQSCSWNIHPAFKIKTFINS